VRRNPERYSPPHVSRIPPREYIYVLAHGLRACKNDTINAVQGQWPYLSNSPHLSHTMRGPRERDTWSSFFAPNCRRKEIERVAAGTQGTSAVDAVMESVLRHGYNQQSARFVDRAQLPSPLLSRPREGPGSWAG